jgi:hypothetical protein
MVRNRLLKYEIIDGPRLLVAVLVVSWLGFGLIGVMVRVR